MDVEYVDWENKMIDKECIQDEIDLLKGRLENCICDVYETGGILQGLKLKLEMINGDLEELGQKLKTE